MNIDLAMLASQSSERRFMTVVCGHTGKTWGLKNLQHPLLHITAFTTALDGKFTTFVTALDRKFTTVFTTIDYILLQLYYISLLLNFYLATV